MVHDALRAYSRLPLKATVSSNAKSRGLERFFFELLLV